MNSTDITYDTLARSWTLAMRPNPVSVPSISFDCAVQFRGNRITVKDCALSGNPDGAVLRRRNVQPKGLVNDKTMMSWGIMRDEIADCWLIMDESGMLLVRTKEIDMDCVGGTDPGGMIAVRAEMLCDGRSNTSQSFALGTVDRVRLRTLIVHNQEVHVETITFGGHQKPL